MGNRLFWAVVAFVWSWASLAAEPVALYFDQVPIRDFAKAVYGDVLKTGYVVHESADQSKISVYVPSSEPSRYERIAADALKASGLDVKKVGGVYVIDKPKFEPGELVTYRPRFRSVSYLGDLLAAAIPDLQTVGRRQMSNIQAIQHNQPGVAPTNTAPITADVGSAAVFDRADKDVLVFRVPFVQLAASRALLDQLDTPEPEVLIRAVAYEVQKGDHVGSALQVVASILSAKLGLDIKGNLAGADSSISLKVGGFEGVLQALDSDARFKSLSRPSVRVKSGAGASFSVGSDVPILGAVVTQNTGATTQSVEYRSSGVLLDVTPYIRRDRIDVKLNQEISAFVQTATGVQNSPTLNKRKAQTELTVADGEIVFIGGLESENDSQSSQNFFGLPVGHSSDVQRSELVLMLEVKRI